MILNDQSLMPFGMYSKPPDGPRKLANVPASYLLWLYENRKYNRELRVYIEDNLDVIKTEAKREIDNKNNNWKHNWK